MSDTSDQVQDNANNQSGTSSAYTPTMLDRIIPPHIQHVFIPEDIEEQLLPDEEVRLEVHLAWYRNVVAFTITHYGPAILVTAISLSLIAAMIAFNFGYSVIFAMQLPFILLLALVFYGMYERFQYLQWRLVKTNNRLIISMPQPDAWYLVDNIELNNNPQVIDANWSTNQARRFMQALTGSRDLYISLVGLQFVQGTAMVKDALIIPDVSEEDIKKLKLLIFG